MKASLAGIPVPVLGIICISFMSLANAANIALGLKEAVQFGIYMVLFAIVFLFASRHKYVSILSAAMTVVCIGVLALSLWQLIADGVSPYGVLRNRNVLCGLVVGLIFVSGAWMESIAGRLGTVCAMLIVAVTAMVVPSSGWVSMGMAVLVLCAIRKSRNVALRIGAAAVLGVAASVFFFRGHFVSQLANLSWIDPNGHDISQRYIEWYAALNMIKENFVLGVGAGNYQLCIGKYFGLLPKLNTLEPDTQNGWLIIGSTMGMVGLCMFVWLFLGAGMQGIKSLRSGSDGKAAGLLGAAVAWGVMSIFTPVFMRETGPFVIIVLGILWAMSSESPTSSVEGKGCKVEGGGVEG
ncbi:O-antigen ligase family protein [Verrucomicrobiota bacterium]